MDALYKHIIVCKYGNLKFEISKPMHQQVRT